jgi:hypothetical protein
MEVCKTFWMEAATNSFHHGASEIYRADPIPFHPAVEVIEKTSFRILILVFYVLEHTYRPVLVNSLSETWGPQAPCD